MKTPDVAYAHTRPDSWYEEHPDEAAKRYRFAEAICRGMTSFHAALYAGWSRTEAFNHGADIRREAYTHKLIAELREKMAEEEILSKNELLLNVKAIAFDEREASKTRISASSLLSKMMGYDAPVKTYAVFEARNLDDFYADAQSSTP